ncbi:MAG: hypothetical protein LBR80_08120 [Deltaproteobacteria bacterium]|jgi:hypothetical protein|nr:hypothetical protein [Deltaproteobacteria bacterium]
MDGYSEDLDADRVTLPLKRPHEGTVTIAETETLESDMANGGKSGPCHVRKVTFTRLAGTIARRQGGRIAVSGLGT